MLGLGLGITKIAGLRSLAQKLLSILRVRSTYYENGADSKEEIQTIYEYELLDKATILLTPTATSDARVHSVKTYTGDELVSNGTYNTDLSGWTNTSTHWQWSSGSAYHPLTTSLFPLKQDITNNVGAVLRITFDLTYVQGTAQCFYKNEANSDVSTTFTSSGSYTIITEPVKANTEINFGRAFGHNTEFYIDNVSVIDVSSDFDFDRASSATRINSSGLVQDMQSITDPELVLNGDFEELGDEEVTDGDFPNLDNWSVNGGDYATIVDGALNSNNTENGSWFAENISQNISFVNGKTYKVTFKAKNISGNLNLRITHQSHIVFSNNLTSSFVDYTVYYTAQANNDSIRIFCNDAIGEFQIDNVSIQQVDPNDRWALDADWSIEDGQAKFGGSTAGYLSQLGTLEVGKTYKIKADVSQGRAVLISAFYDIHDSDEISSEGNIFTVTSGTDLKIYSHPSNGATVIDNISVKDITFSTDVDLARINYDSNGQNGHILLEPTSTNLITYSEDFSQSAWSKVDVLIEGGYTAPDGSNNAYKVTKNGSNAHLVGFNNQNTSKHKSIWAKTVSGTGDVYLLNQNTNNVFSLTNEWQRFDVAHTGANWFYAVDFRNSALTEVIVWGAQLEALGYATSYIPTLTGSTVTRATETLTGSGNSTLINSTEGVLYAEIAALADDLTRRRITLSDGTTNNRINLYFENVSNTIEAFINGSGGNDTMIYTSSDTTQFHKIAVLYKDGESSLWVDGVERDTSTTTFSLANLSNLDFQQGGLTGDVFYGKCKALAVFNEALTDDELELLTGVTNYGSFSELASTNGYTII